MTEKYFKKYFTNQQQYGIILYVQWKSSLNYNSQVCADQMNFVHLADGIASGSVTTVHLLRLERFYRFDIELARVSRADFTE